MPVVPRYDRQAQPQGLPSPRLSPEAPIEAFGGGKSAAELGGSLQQLGGAVQTYAAEQKKRADQIAVLDYESGLTELGTRLLYDPKTGALTRKGKDAFGLPDTVREQFDQQADELEKSLVNEDQRSLARRARTTHWDDLDRRVQVHVAGEIDRFDQQVSKSFIENEQNAAAANYNDPQRVQTSIERQQLALAQQAQRNGLPPEWLAQAVTEATSKTHFSVVQRMLANGDDRDAKSYYEKIRDQVSGSDATAIERALQEGSTRGESQRQATRIIAEYGDDLKGALAAARQLEDPKIQEATVQEVKTRHEELRKGRQEAEEKLFRTAANVVENTKDRPDATTWSQLSLQERTALDARIKQLRAGVAPETDWDTYYNLKTQAATPELKDKFLGTNLMIFRPKLADTEFKELVTAQEALRGGKSSIELFNGYRTDKQIVDDALSAAGIDPTPKQGKEDARKVNDFRSKVDQEIREIQARTGKKATTEDVQRIVDQMLIKVRVPGKWWGTNEKRLFEVTPGEADKVTVTIDEIPKADKEAITRALVKRSVPVTDDEIIRWYVRGINAH